MAKKQLVEIVNRLKKSGVKVSITKPRSEFFHLQQNKKHAVVNPH